MKLPLFFVAILAVSFSKTYAQDTVWIGKFGNIVSVKDSAELYKVVYKNPADSQKVKVITFQSDCTMLNESNYYPYTPNPILNGISKYYFNGFLKEIRNYANNRLIGNHITFWENGKQKRKDLYENGKFISGNCYGVDGADTAWFPYELQAQFPGGKDSLFRFINRNFRYPTQAAAENIQGVVKVKFTINTDGALEDIKVVNSVHPILDNEALRLVKLMPRWQPGIMDGKKVKSFFVLPLTFRVNE